MVIERDAEIRMDDGVALHADVFRPEGADQVPVVMTLGPYGKGVRYQDSYKAQWDSLIEAHPDLLEGSSRSYLTWETVDPEIWVPWGYAVVRVDSRGAGRSPGYLDPFSPREVCDYVEAIEWAGSRPWSNGKVGLCGISYYAINQWQAAALQPTHLAAMIPWEGAADAYRDQARHGGILSNVFFQTWYPLQVLSVQHGNPHAPIDPWLGQRSSGPEELSEQELATNRADMFARMAQPLDGVSYQERSADWPRVTVPFLSAANWGGFGLHSRGNFEAFTQAASGQKWLEVHPGRHEEWFYLPYGMELQRRFLDHFLKGVDNGWQHEPRVQLNIRRAFSDQFELRKEHEWPLARTRWTKLYLDAAADSLNWALPATAGTMSIQGMGQPATLYSPPLAEETEITGPLAATMFISSTTTDADIFVTLRAFGPDGQEVDFQGTLDPRTPLAQGCLRASQRKLDPARSEPYRPYHPHDEVQALQPGEIYELQVEIWPTCIIVPAGFRLALTIGGVDFARQTPTAGPPVFLGSALFLHTDPHDRPRDIFDGTTTIHTGPDTPAHVLLPTIPAQAPREN
ncbi:MAG: CocE/NonD family hydrolase [Mycobacterium sp.]|nr:CocE/NonD family hydrolase [Mycobacterium sp.]MBV8291268.1 CocE/NonD family hydrolase [Mycobacterium sp.]